MSPKRYNLAVCAFPGQGHDPASDMWVKNYIDIWKHHPRIQDFVYLEAADTPVTMVRNLMVQTCRARQPKIDYILMIDADMKPDIVYGADPLAKPYWESSWDFLMSRRDDEEVFRASSLHCAGDPSLVDEQAFQAYPYATIGAPYCSAPPQETVMVFRWYREENAEPGMNRKYGIKWYDRDIASKFTGIMEVAALGTGLIMYDARVFDRLPPPHFEYEYSDFPINSKKITTEDVYQTRNASICGMPQYCNWDAWSGHRKIKTVGKPNLVDVTDIPDTLADAIRSGTRGHRVKVSPDLKVVKPANHLEAMIPERTAAALEGRPLDVTCKQPERRQQPAH